MVHHTVTTAQRLGPVTAAPIAHTLTRRLDATPTQRPKIRIPPNYSSRGQTEIARFVNSSISTTLSLAVSIFNLKSPLVTNALNWIPGCPGLPFWQPAQGRPPFFSTWVEPASLGHRWIDDGGSSAEVPFVDSIIRAHARNLAMIGSALTLSVCINIMDISSSRASMISMSN